MMQVYNFPMFSTPPVMNTTINGPAMQLREMFGYSIQTVFTGTPTGTFHLEASSDKIPQGAPPSYTPINWTTVINTPYSVTAAGNYMWNVSEVMYNWVRLVYVDTSGGTSTAVITVATFNGKGV